MATKSKEVLEKAVMPDTNIPARFRFSEMGNMGIKVFNGVTQDEIKGELNFPRSVQTFKEMSYHSAVNAPLTLYENLIGKLTWSYKPPVDATQEEIDRCKLVASMMEDMDQPWSEFIRDVLTSLTYGFSVHEINFRKRLKDKGSKHNDGVIAWSGLPIRAQESIKKFEFSDSGREIIGVVQDLTLMQNANNRFGATLANSQITIPRKKILHFRMGKHRGDPFGKSPLRDCYLSWRYLMTLEEIEATGIAKDLTGFPVLHIPMEFMSDNAPDSHKAFRKYCEESIRNIQAGKQAGMVMPVAFDEASKQPLFKIELLSTDGKRTFDIDQTKTYYKNLILTSLFGDLLTMGQTTTGSFALGAIKNSLSGSYAERIVDSIVDVLNQDLARTIYELNGWDTARMGSFDYDGLDTADLDNLGKFLQRTASVGLVEKDRQFMNAVRKAVGIDAKPDDLEPQQQYLDVTSSAGQGMDTPFEGTATSSTAGNSSDNNNDNAA